MDVTDALRRIVLRHLVLITVATLVPLVGFIFYKGGQPPSYTASAQVEVAYKASTSAQAATSTADTPSAFAKAPDTVAGALKAVGVAHDVPDFIKNNLTISPVLTAPDIQIVVRYKTRQDAVNIAQALAQATVDHFYGQAKAGPQKDFDVFSAQLDAARKQLAADQAAANKVPAALQTQVTASELTADTTTISTLQKAVTDAQSRLNEADAEKPTIVNQAQIVPQTTLSELQPYVLVFFVGLILGVGLAAIVESVSPSVVGAAGLSGLFGAPFLGHAVGRGGKPGTLALGKNRTKNRISDLALAARLHAAARRVGADTVVLAGDIRCALPDLAERLDTLLGGATDKELGGTVPGQTVASDSTTSASGGSDAGGTSGSSAGSTSGGSSGSAAEPSKELATRQTSNLPALFSERMSFGEGIPSVWLHPRVVPYDEQVLLLLSTAPVSVAVAVVGAPKGKRSHLRPAVELVETSGWEVLGTIMADPIRDPRDPRTSEAG
ncbi:MAG: hypothetical protein HOW97_13755 [Catenulispora sp.]|nr:hypothetical protein [Catenulispora sp.]